MSAVWLRSATSLANLLPTPPPSQPPRSLPQSYKVPAGDTAAIDSAIASITSDLGELDVVICNAGICTHVASHECTDDQFRQTFETNTFFPYFLSRAVFNSWFPNGPKEGDKKDKSILFVSSMSGIVSNTPQQQCAYNASKAALTHLGKSLAGDWAPQGIRVNILSPGYIATEMSKGSEAGKVMGDEWERRTPMGRFAEPREIAETLLFLSSSMSTFMTGSDVVADGGYTIF